jgi:hypothetical protein
LRKDAQALRHPDENCVAYFWTEIVVRRLEIIEIEQNQGKLRRLIRGFGEQGIEELDEVSTGGQPRECIQMSAWVLSIEQSIDVVSPENQREVFEGGSI